MTIETKDPSRQSIALARSPESAQPGELVLLDDAGRPVGQGRLSLKWVTSGLAVWVGIGAAMGVVSTLVGVSIWWFIPLVFLASHFRGRTGRALLRVQSKLAAGDMASAEEALATAPQPERGRLGALRARLEGYLADGKGDTRRAIGHYERSLERYPGRIDGIISRIMLVDALARDGQTDRARELRTNIDAAPGSTMTALMLAQADLTLAITSGNESELDADTLHEWVQLALAHNSTKNVLILLARVLATRQDDDLSDHCLRESEARFDWCSLEKTFPAMHDWAVARAEQVGASEPRGLEGV